MALAYLLDENLRGRPWQALQRHNASGNVPVDVARVGDPPDLPLGTPDEDLLAWCERQGRVLVSFDRRTLPIELAEHLRRGGHCPGAFLIRRGASLREVLDILVLIAHAGDPDDYRDNVTYVP